MKIRRGVWSQTSDVLPEEGLEVLMYFSDSDELVIGSREGAYWSFDGIGSVDGDEAPGWWMIPLRPGESEEV